MNCNRILTTGLNHTILYHSITVLRHYHGLITHAGRLIQAMCYCLLSFQVRFWSTLFNTDFKWTRTSSPYVALAPDCDIIHARIIKMLLEIMSPRTYVNHKALDKHAWTMCEHEKSTGRPLIITYAPLIR